MTEPRPIRVTEFQRIIEPGRTVESARVVEFSAPTPTGPPELPGRRGYDPARDSPMADTGMELDGCGPARLALPPAPAHPPWWRRWLR